MNTYNLNDDTEEHFIFSLGGHSYRMRYPLIEELEEIEEINNKVSQDHDKQSAEAMNQKLYSFITPVAEDAPAIEEVMRKQNVQVVRNFLEMIRAEISLG